VIRPPASAVENGSCFRRSALKLKNRFQLRQGWDTRFCRSPKVPGELGLARAKERRRQRSEELKEEEPKEEEPKEEQDAVEPVAARAVTGGGAGGRRVVWRWLWQLLPSVAPRRCLRPTLFS
jgi:hypothetical protein